MNVTTNLDPTSGFTRIPNEAINSDLTNAEFRLWAKMLADLKGEDAVTFDDVHEAAKHYDMKADAFRNQRRGLKLKGFLSGTPSNLVVTLPDADFKAPEKEVKRVAKEDIEDPDFSIAMQQRKQEKRKTTLTEAERKTLMREAWNKHMPKGELWVEHEGSVEQAVYNAIECHTKFLGVNRDDYDAFMGQVLRGCAVDEYYSKRRRNPIKMQTVFGWVAFYKGEKGPTDSDYRRVKELYKLGGSAKAQSRAFDGSDEAFLKWYHSKRLTQFTKVERIQIEDREKAEDLELLTPATDTIVVYENAEGKLLHWTWKYKDSRIGYLPS